MTDPSACLSPSLSQCTWYGSVDWPSTDGTKGYRNTLTTGTQWGDYSYALYYYVGFLGQAYPISGCVNVDSFPSASSVTLTISNQTGSVLFEWTSSSSTNFGCFNYYP